MNQLPILIKREYWEHRATFLYLPAIMTAILIAILILVGTGLQFDLIEVTVTDRGDEGSEHSIVIESNSDGADEDQTSLFNLFGVQLQRLAASPMEDREQMLDQLYYGSSMILLAVSWFVMFFYLTGCLFEDRKDRSILFWKSMPVSDWITVIAKLITALFLIPAIYMVFIVLSNMAMLLISTVLALGQPVEIWDTLWAPANLPSRWLHLTGYVLYSSAWCLPFTGWVLLVSSCARSATLAWIFGIPILISIIEAIFTRSEVLRSFFAAHIITSNPRGNFAVNGLTIEMPVALIVGGILIAAAIWQRGRAGEI